MHLALGARLVRKRVLDPTDLLHAIMHFHGAGHVNYAAALLMNGLRTVLEKGELGDAQLLLLVWGDMPVPSQVSITLQIFLRAHQIEVRSRYAYDVDFAVSDLERLVNAVSDEESWALISIVAVAGTSLTHLRPILANRILLRVAQLWRTWRRPDGQPLLSTEGLEPEELLWMPVLHLQTRDQVVNWLDTIRQLSPDGRENCRI